MSKDSNESDHENPNPEKVKQEILQLFKEDTLKPHDFEQTPEEVAENIRSQAAMCNQVVRPAADLSGEITQVGAAGVAESFDSIKNKDDRKVEPEDSEELIDEFEQLTSEDSKVIRTADEAFNSLIPLYGKSEMNADDTFTFLQVYNDMRDICPETAKVYSGMIEVLGRAEALDKYKVDT